MTKSLRRRQTTSRRSRPRDSSNNCRKGDKIAEKYVIGY